MAPRAAVIAARVSVAVVAGSGPVAGFARLIRPPEFGMPFRVPRPAHPRPADVAARTRFPVPPGRAAGYGRTLPAGFGVAMPVPVARDKRPPRNCTARP